MNENEYEEYLKTINIHSIQLTRKNLEGFADKNKNYMIRLAYGNEVIYIKRYKYFNLITMKWE